MQPRLTGYAIDSGYRRRGGPNQEARIETLRQVTLFKDLSRRHLTRIDQISTVTTAREGTVLMQQGDPGNEMMVVLTGRASVRRGNRKIAECVPGQSLGEMALLDSMPRSATVTALEPMRLVVIPGPAFRKLLPKVPRLAEALLAAMSSRLREANAATDF